MTVIVVGCGVSGLTSAVRLAESGLKVRIWAAQRPDHPPFTTSNVAAAVWYPYHVEPLEKVVPWGKAAYEEFCRIAAGEDAVEAGVEVLELYEFFDHAHKHYAVAPPWHEYVRDFAMLGPHELLPGYDAGFRFLSPVIDMSLYLPYLLKRFEAAQGIVEWPHPVESLDEPFRCASTVVNCSGLGARTLANDQDLLPGWGQIVCVKPYIVTPRRVIVDQYGRDQHGEPQPTYIVPRVNDCVLGGFDIKGRESLDVEDACTENIVERCSRLVPEVEQIVEWVPRVGLRPLRSAVRLEANTHSSGGLLIHNYGHGGAGVTLSWGCADEVLRLASRDRPADLVSVA